MAKADLLQLLGWCSAIYILLLLSWIVMFIFTRDWIYNLHSKLFAMPEEKINQIHYALMGFFKLIIVIFFLVPYLVLRAIRMLI